ncbi:MAG: ATP phosphoribosyltransferase, partial [Anaerolineae bacterium]|nr:ATP phosphoribosyltransferase [Anaerolineae bacterium]
MKEPITSEEGTVTLALPSKGQLEEGTLQFLASCGLGVAKVNPRQYQAEMPALPQVRVLFQRAEDVVTQVAVGTADLGITGLDLVMEEGEQGERLFLLHEALGYGHCDLVLAVPEGWLDVDSIADLADLAPEFRARHGRDLRVATKFPNLVRAFLYEHEIVQFQIVPGRGAIEAAPALGYADLVADLTATRTTLRENRLKEIAGGTILRSQACFIGNRQALLQRPAVLDVACRMLDQMEAALAGRRHHTLSTCLPAASAEEANRKVRSLLRGAGARVLDLSPLPALGQSPSPEWSLTLLVPARSLMVLAQRVKE